MTLQVVGSPEEPRSIPRQPVRRLIKVDFDKFQDEEDDEEDSSILRGDEEHHQLPPRPAPRTSTPRTNDCTPKPWKRTESVSAERYSGGGSPPPLTVRHPPSRPRLTHHEYHQFCDTTLESYDLATQCESRRASMRRHASATGVSALHVTPHAAPRSMPHSRPDSRQSHVDMERSDGSLSWSRSSLQDDLVKTQDKMASDDRVSLTLEEVVHIRSVLTESELENLPIENNIKDEVVKKKICFLCLKTRFTLFGPWGHRCKLCKKTVCQKCHSKMRIPMEHFSTVPVVLLSPSLLPSPEEENNSSFPRSLMARLVTSQRNERPGNCVGSTPNSPVPQRNNPMARSLEGSLDGNTRTGRGTMRSTPTSRGESPALISLPANNVMTKSYDGPQSMPFMTPTRSDRMVKSNVVERLRGTPVSICNDCRDFVLKVIRASQIARADSRHRALQHLTLDLTPVYSPHAY